LAGFVGWSGWMQCYPPPSNQSTQRTLPKRGSRNSRNIKLTDVFYSLGTWLVYYAPRMNYFNNHKLRVCEAIFEIHEYFWITYVTYVTWIKEEL
jgi:hypothetical protein